MRFEGKTAAVTGAAQGIGEAIAKRLFDEGAAFIALIDRDALKAEKAAARLDSDGTRAQGYGCDVSDHEDTLRVFAEIGRQRGPAQILVNNAGITRDAMFHKMSEAMWDEVIAVNLKGLYNCCQAVVPSMRECRYGKIVNIASVSAFGNLGQTNYGASKAGVIGFTKCLARELARNQITVNCIAPSYINTAMLHAVPEQTMRRFLAAIPMERLGEPEELAAAAAFLCADDSSFVTGECLVVSGGAYM